MTDGSWFLSFIHGYCDDCKECADEVKKKYTIATLNKQILKHKEGNRKFDYETKKLWSSFCNREDGTCRYYHEIGKLMWEMRGELKINHLISRAPKEDPSFKWILRNPKQKELA
jgi:hypothetical protein